MDVLTHYETRRLLMEHTGIDPDIKMVGDQQVYNDTIKAHTAAEARAGQRIAADRGTEQDQQTLLGLIARASVRACHACAVEPNEQVHRYEAARIVLLTEREGYGARGKSNPEDCR